MSFNITPVASGYQQIHPYSAMNIDSVKINTSLIMMKECYVFCICLLTYRYQKYKSVELGDQLEILVHLKVQKQLLIIWQDLN